MTKIDMGDLTSSHLKQCVIIDVVDDEHKNQIRIWNKYVQPSLYPLEKADNYGDNLYVKVPSLDEPTVNLVVDKIISIYEKNKMGFQLSNVHRPNVTSR